MRLQDLLTSLAEDLTQRLDADACVVSRALGDVLVMVAQATRDGGRIELTQGFLVPDYPATEHVLETRLPVALTLDDPDVDEAEAALLRGLDYASLLMLPLDLAGEAWGLVEVYRRELRPFATADIASAQAELSRLP